MNIKPLEKEHMAELALHIQDAQQYMVAYIHQPWYYDALTNSGEAFAVLRDDGSVALCAGVIKQWHGRYVAWALFSENIGMSMLGLVRGIRRFLDLQDFRRVEAYVDIHHLAGIRLVEMLGFKFDGTMKRFTPEDRDNYMYSRVKA